MQRQTNRRTRWAWIAATCCFVSACGGFDDGSFNGTNGTGGSTSTTSSPQSLTGSMRGSMGSVESFATDAATVAVPAGATSFRLDTPRDAHNWAMTNIVLTQPLTGDAWTPGTTRSADIAQTSGDPNIAGAVGCSGPSYEDWTFDQHASRVTVHVDDGSTPGSRLVTFAVYWDATSSNPAQAVTGSFELPAAAGP